MSSAQLFPPKRLGRAGDIRAVFKARHVKRGAFVDVHWRDSNSVGYPRFTVVAGKRVGTAVVRNRAKRRIRSAVVEDGMPLGRDAVFVAKPGANLAPYEALRADIGPVRRIHISNRGTQ